MSFVRNSMNSMDELDLELIDLISKEAKKNADNMEKEAPDIFLQTWRDIEESGIVPFPKETCGEKEENDCDCAEDNGAGVEFCNCGYNGDCQYCKKEIRERKEEKKNGDTKKASEVEASKCRNGYDCCDCAHVKGKDCEYN